MKKKVVSLTLVLCMLLSFMPIIASAATSGTCGSNLTWTLDDNGTLTISGTGEMDNWGYNSFPWYSKRESVRDVIIENGVTSVGKNAFYGCESLISVKISNSVTSIGIHAFGGCSSLISIIIPNSVTSIGDSAFRDCSSLISITISNSVTSIGDTVFLYCSSLTSITIPDGVTSIGDSAFDSCSSLTSITIPNGVTSIGNYAFEDCSSLTIITIPQSVTSIGEYVFGKCSNLTDILVDKYNQYYSSENGILFNKDKSNLIQYPIGKIDTQYTIPNSVTNIGDLAFADCYNLINIIIPDSVTNIGKYAFSECRNLKNIKVDEKNLFYCSIEGILYNSDKTTLIQYAAGKTNKTFDILKGVTNIGNSAFDYCENLISVTIPDSVTSIGWKAFYKCSSLVSITIPDNVIKIGNSAFSYCYRLTDVYYGGNAEQWKDIHIGYLNDELANATKHYNSSGIPAGTKGNTNSTSNGAPIIASAKASLSGKTYDLLSDNLNVEKDSSNTYSVEGAVDANGGSDIHLYLTQGAKKAIEIPLNACKDIQIGKEFSAGQPIYITAIDKKTGKSTSKRTKLSVVGNSMFDGSLSDGAIDILDDFFVDIPDEVPVIGKEKIGLSLGSIKSNVEIDGNSFKVALGSDVMAGKRKDGKWEKSDWNGFKDGFKDAKKNAVLNSAKYVGKYGSLTNMKIKSGTSGSASATGYLEGYIDDSGMHISEGGIILSGEIKYKYQGMTVVVVVPVYYEIGAGGEVTAVLGVKDLVPGNGLQGAFTGSITPAVFFEVGGGIGIPVVFTAGVSGKVKAELEVALNKVYQKLDVTGTAKFKLEGPFGIPTYEKPFAEGKFHVYETGNKNTLLGKKLNLYSADDYNSNDPYSLIDIDAPITITEHGDSTQQWVGDSDDIELEAVDYTNQEVKVLEENSYESTAPILANMDGKNVIAWVTDNKDRADGDKNMLVYSVEENGKWSKPEAVYDDGFADSTPQMKDGYIVWQKATKNVTEDMSLRDLGEVCEIYMAKWNGNGFDTPIRVTQNALLDQTPQISVNNGNATVVWVQNSDNNLMGTTGENSIMSYTNGTVKTEKTVTKAITNMSIEFIDGILNIAYEADWDNNLSTIDDREIYNIADGKVKIITDNSIADTHPLYGELNGDIVLFYYSDGKIVYLKDGTENTVVSGIATDQFTTVSNGNSTAVLWTAVNEGNAELHGALYDGNVWSEDVQVSDLGKRIKFPSAVMQSDGNIFAAFNRTEKVPNEYYYDDGQSDLCTIKITPSYDLELSDAYFDEKDMKAYAKVKNIGELNVDSYTVSLNDNGVTTRKVISEPLKAGESADIEMAYNKPSDLSARKLTLSVSLATGEEYNKDNNSAEFTVGNADVEVSNVAINEDETKVTADVSNIGYSNANNVTVSLREGSAEGTVIDKQTVNLAANANKSVEFDINKNDIRFYDSSTALYVIAEYNGDEASLGNNDGYVIITSDSGSADYEIQVLDYSAIDGKYVVNSVARNNTTDKIGCILYSAVYSSDGILKGSGKVNANIDADDDTGVDITVDCTIETGDTIKTFMWDKNMLPLAKNAELVVE